MLKSKDTRIIKMKKFIRYISLFLFIFCYAVNLSADITSLKEFMIQKRIISCPKLTGRVIFPGELGYNEARLVSNYYTSKDKFPAVIVYCQNTLDVKNAVKWARCHNIPIRIRSGGHNHEAFSTGTGVIVIDVSEMKRIQLDKLNNIATIQPGLNNLELYSSLYKEGFTHVGGTCSEVGLSGLALTGGIGPLYRRAGLTCDNLVDVEIVNADGQVIHATKDNDYRDLFWALCGGGGGNFGVVTSMVIKVYPADDVTWFNIGWDWSQPIDKVIVAWQDFFSKTDKRWFSHLDIWSKVFPSEKLNKSPVKVLGVFWGTPEEARQQLAPLLNIGTPSNQTIELVDWNKAILMIEESTAVFLTSKPEYKTSAAYAMENLPADAVSIISKTLQETTAPLFNVLLFTLGETPKNKSSADTAYYYRNAKFFVSYTLQWLQQKEDKIRVVELDNLRKKLLSYTEGDYVGNPDTSLKNYLEAYYGENVGKLRCIKKKYDPQNVFNFPQSIPPAPLLWDCEKGK